MEKIYPKTMPGAALLIVKDNKIIFKEGFGIADMYKYKKITPDTHFRMASVSKQFTAMCILVLQKQGKLKITDPAKKYLPSLPEFANTITIKNFMTHTSGIADYESLIPEDQKEQVTDADVLRLLSKSDSLYFSPGTRFRYSNTGFCLLTQIVEKVSGISYPDFIQKNIFLPLRMTKATIYKKNKKIFDRAYGYHFDNSQWKFADQSITSATMGDGSVYTSLNEYRNWIQQLWKWQSEDSLLNPFQSHAKVSSKLSYGYGWFIAREKDGTSAYFHSGESTGFHNIVYQNPSKKLMIVLFSNCDDDRVAQAFNEVSAMLNIAFDAVPAGKTLFEFLSSIYEN